MSKRKRLHGAARKLFDSEELAGESRVHANNTKYFCAWSCWEPPVVTRGAVKGAVGAFLLTLESSPSHFIIELGTKRNAVQLSFVP